MSNKYTEEELKKYWIAICPVCGWEGLSRDCYGGDAIADTGDYSDVICPRCFDEREECISIEEKDYV